MSKLYLFEVSADNGRTWTDQRLTENEAEKEEYEYGHIARYKDMCLYYRKI